jgi:hypothetical protein
MALSVLNHDANEADGSGGAIAAAARNHVAGNLLVVGCQLQTNTGATTMALSNTALDTWNEVAGARVSSGNNRLQIFWAITAGNASDIVTATPDVNCTFRALDCYQVTDSNGSFSGTPTDDDDNGSGTSTNITCVNSVAVTAAEDFMFAFLLYTSASVAAGTGYTLSTTGLGSFWASQYKIVTASETPFATGSASAAYVIAAASFKGVAAAGGGVTYPRLERAQRGVNRGRNGGIARSFVRRSRIFVPVYAWTGTPLQAAA